MVPSRSRVLARGLSLGAAAFLAMATVVASQTVSIDPSQGAIDGRAALSFWPHQGTNPDNLLDPDGFEVHLVPFDDLNKELVYPCGTWIEPPPNRYKFWLEGHDQVSPHANVLVFTGGPFTGKGGASVSRVVPAARVGVSQPGGLVPPLALRLLHVGNPSGEEVLSREFSRRVTGVAAYDGVLMPTGELIAALYDDAEKEYVGLTRPFSVNAGEKVRVLPRPPSEGTDLLVVLERPRGIATAEEDDVRLVLRGTSRHLAPELRAANVDRIYAAWYGLQERYVVLDVLSQSVRLDAQEIPLRPRRVEVLRGTLKDPPSLDVEIDIPAELSAETVTLSIIDSPNRARTVLKQVTLEWSTREHHFDRLPARRLEAMLTAGLWDARKWADLTDGENKSVSLRLDVLPVSGRVYRGDKGHPAKLRFRTSRVRPTDELVVETDSQGAYETTVFRTGTYNVFLELGSRGGTPFVELVEIGEGGNTKLDFRVPGNEFSVKVLDATNGRGIEGARIHADNVMENGRTISQPTVTDEDGVALLQPLRPGRLVLDVRAKGFKYPGRNDQEVPESSGGEFVVELHPLGSRAGLRLQLPDGSPAVGAEVRAQAALGNAPVLWQSQTDDRGALRVPESLAGHYLLVRHHSSAFRVRRWTAGDVEATWRLPAKAPPLTLAVKETWQKSAPWVPLAMDVEGTILSGTTLSWLTSSSLASTDSQGLWRGGNLPQGPLRVMAWRGRDGAPLADVFEAGATPIAYPWTGLVEVEAWP